MQRVWTSARCLKIPIASACGETSAMMSDKLETLDAHVCKGSARATGSQQQVHLNASSARMMASMRKQCDCCRSWRCAAFRANHESHGKQVFTDLPPAATLPNYLAAYPKLAGRAGLPSASAWRPTNDHTKDKTSSKEPRVLTIVKLQGCSDSCADLEALSSSMAAWHA